jgi:hypothetical protein
MMVPVQGFAKYSIVK